MKRNEQGKTNSERDGGLSIDLIQCNYPSLSDSHLPLTSVNGQIEQKCNSLGYCYTTGITQTNRVDTLWLAIPDRVIETATRKGSVLGLKFRNYDYRNKCEFWQCSAKLLKSDYFELIYKDNIQQIISAINNSGLLKVNEQEFYNNVRVLFADFTADIKIENKQNMLSTLSTCVINKPWRRDPFQKGYAYETILFVSKAKHRNSLKFYDKFSEMFQHTDDEILQYIDIHKADNLLRVECRCKNLDAFRNVI